jgi:hypothetical protein
MFTKTMSDSAGLGKNIWQLCKLQFQLYAEELGRARNNLFLLASLGAIAMTLLLSCCVIGLIAIAFFLTQWGLSWGAALGITALITLAMIGVICLYAAYIVRVQIRRISVSNEELKTNMALVRAQLFRSRKARSQVESNSVH